MAGAASNRSRKNGGVPWIWVCAAAVAASVAMVIGLVLLIAVKGLAYFWPATVLEFDYRAEDAAAGGTVRIIGELAGKGTVSVAEGEATVVAQRLLLKTGNRDFYGADFRWLLRDAMGELRAPRELTLVERREWGNLYGYLQGLEEDGRGLEARDDAQLWRLLQDRIAAAQGLYARIRVLEKEEIGKANYRLEKLRLQERRLQLEGAATPAAVAALAAQRQQLLARHARIGQRLGELRRELARAQMLLRLSDGRTVTVPIAQVHRAYRPNAMTPLARGGFFCGKLWEFLTEDPREANTEGGVFPAIYGTVLMVLLMTLLVSPFGVIAAIYLHEYARQNLLTRIVRISVNNLAGIPSVVYGVFGLGFFVYFAGGALDRLFFPEALPTPTFGTPGLLWASMTLALLTVPVVIVATEEGLSRVPRALREGSLALGATQAETLFRTVLPITAPAILTGQILAISRAAGEVAPLMLVGAVKLAPSLPIDGNFPYFHLERKFMHLGFHIYDVGFQSPNVEAARPLVYATALLLVLIVLVLNLIAIVIRNRLRRRVS
ncbi:MAG: phosphate ABC transporter permease PstA [Gammaproteobacteria bacterium]|nr:phosphate ABC transporter permease PstA [Gammaproteobacteria bacterium]MDD9824425.1 phosphate ABC transporter permease PstA [Gammaproteobacteria bacterium]MDD9863322.1 phosphate ABC transporter permease PstA [Gammaproteobacteria bacterium]